MESPLSPVCSLSKPGKDSARNCALNLLIKVMRREIIPGEEATAEIAYSPQEIEQIIYDTYPSRDSYLDKIAKVALHLSLFTRTGRVSYTFQNHIFDKTLKVNQQSDVDFLQHLLTTATDEEVFPELYLSFDFVQERDRQAFQENMAIEHAAILAGLQEVVRKCCDSKVCTVQEINDTYDEELFKDGSVFRTAAQSVCISRRVKSWIPPSSEIYIPDTSPVNLETNEANEPDNSLSLSREFRSPVDDRDDSVPLGPITFDNMLYGDLSPPNVTQPMTPTRLETNYDETRDVNLAFSDVSALNQAGPQGIRATTMGLAVTPTIGDINLSRSVYVSQPAKPKINRNFGVSAELRCYDPNNLIHNLATLTPGKLVELPFGSDLLDEDVQNQLFEKFRTEIGMRRYYLSTLAEA